MDFKNPITHNCTIQCPNCNHSYPYNFKIEDMKLSTHRVDNIEKSYDFLTYLICKNPLCNYDIEIKGEVVIDSSNILDSVKITSIK